MTMSTIEDDELPKEGLYHYTDAAGMLGILQSHSLWATHVSFMNDEKEFMFGVEAVIDELSEAVKSTPTPDSSNRIVNWLTKVISTGVAEAVAKTAVTNRANEILNKYGPFLTCLSSERDDLSQWRGYSGYGGYAIGFDATKLHESVKESIDGVRVEEAQRPFGPLTLGRRYFKKVLYETDTADIRRRLETFMQQIDREDSDEEIREKGLQWIFDLAVRTKHKAFELENEYRIVTYDTASLFHSGTLGITPRIAIEFSPQCVTEVVVGPGTDMDTRVSSIDFFRRAHPHYSHVKVERSIAPYRNA